MATEQILKILTFIVVSCYALPTERENSTIIFERRDILETMKDSKSINDNGLNETLRVEAEADPELIGGYLQGDMVIRRTYNGAVHPGMRWPNAIVHYKLNSIFDAGHAAFILDAMKIIESRSCIRFQPATKATKAFVNIVGKPRGCFSSVGYIGKEQPLNLQAHDLGTGCFQIGSILHELLHTLGFYHQHTVPERDSYVKIVIENILPGNSMSFRKQSDETVTSFGVAYDYHSVMHYSAKAFSKNGRDTIIPLKGENVQIGQRYYLSEGDTKKLNLMYDCN